MLKTRRVRRLKAVDVLAILTTKPLFAAPGVEAAATAHIRALAARINLVNQQLKAAHHQLDMLSAKLKTPAKESEPGQHCEQHDVEILRSMPGNGRIISATLLTEAWDLLQRRDYRALRTLSGVCPGDPAERQATYRAAALRLQPTAGQRDLSLGTGCEPGGSQMSGSLRRTTPTRPSAWPCP